MTISRNTVTAFALCAAAAFLTGCQTGARHADASAAALSQDDALALAVMSSVEPLAAEQQSPSSTTDVAAAFTLGAGDDLGQRVFVQYVAAMRMERADGAMFATGASDAPE